MKKGDIVEVEILDKPDSKRKIMITRKCGDGFCLGVKLDGTYGFAKIEGEFDESDTNVKSIACEIIRQIKRDFHIEDAFEDEDIKHMEEIAEELLIEIDI